MTKPLSKRVVCAALLAALPHLAMAQQPPAPRPDAPVAGAGADAVAQDAAPLTDGVAGPYLAARLAVTEGDVSVAADYFQRLLAQGVSDADLRDNALVALISAGRVDQAVPLADAMLAEGAQTPVSRLLLIARAARVGDWPGLIGRLDDGAALAGVEQLQDGLIRAWAQMGAGQASEAMAGFDRLAKLRGAGPLVHYQAALAKALAGDFEGAAALLDDPVTSGHLMGFVARVQAMAQIDQREQAVALIDGLPHAGSEPSLVALRGALMTGLPVGFDVVRQPADGVAQVLLTFATVLTDGPDPDPMALVHARLAAWLSPDLAEARLLSAQLLQAQGQLDLAEAEYAALLDLGAMRPVAALSRIEALSRADRKPEAVAAAAALVAAHPDLAQVWIAQGDLLRQTGAFDAAVQSYDQALALMEGATGDERWFPLYARGIAQERAGRFDAAEADLQAAIALRPDEPSLLNYLGYSWIDRNQRLDEGLALIKRAVELAPDDGYILDSLAWAYYRLGRFDDAVAPMEQAVLTMSSDPVINDHLGDIYWMVGRKREAEVQWHRALSLNPAPDSDVDPDRIRDKLERGLDAVLADEAAAGTAQGGPKPPPVTAPDPIPAMQ